MGSWMTRSRQSLIEQGRQSLTGQGQALQYYRRHVGYIGRARIALGIKAGLGHDAAGFFGHVYRIRKAAACRCGRC